MKKNIRRVIHCVADGRDYPAIEREYGSYGLVVIITGTPRIVRSLLSKRALAGFDPCKNTYKRGPLAGGKKKRSNRHGLLGKRSIKQFDTNVRMGRGPGV